MNTSFKYKFAFAIFSGLSFAVLTSLFDIFLLEEIFSWGKFTYRFIFFGIFFGFGFSYFSKVMSNRLMKSIQIELNENETVKHEGPANLFRGMEGVGGKLFLTDHRIIFKSHKMNMQSGETQISLDELEAAQPRKTAKIFQNGIRLINRNGKAFDFVVN